LLNNVQNVSTPSGVMPLNFQLNKAKAAQVSDTTDDATTTKAGTTIFL